MPSINAKYGNTGFAYVQKLVGSIGQGEAISGILVETYHRLYDPIPSNLRSADTLKMIQKYWKDQQYVAIFITPDDETEALMLSRKAHLFPISHSTQDNLSSPLSQDILDYSEILKPGDKILVLTDPRNSLVRIQKQVLLTLCSRFDLREIKRTTQGISLMKLQARSTKPSGYCSMLQE
jgi:hypothetical protein